jgi:hypothetical protein
MSSQDINLPPTEEVEETLELKKVPFQHEDEETFELRLTYEQALKEVEPNLDEESATMIALMVVKKARYGVNYEEEVELLIEDLNRRIRQFYSQPVD